MNAGDDINQLKHCKKTMPCYYIKTYMHRLEKLLVIPTWWTVCATRWSCNRISTSWTNHGSERLVRTLVSYRTFQTGRCSCCVPILPIRTVLWCHHSICRTFLPWNVKIINVCTTELCKCPLVCVNLPRRLASHAASFQGFIYWYMKDP